MSKRQHSYEWLNRILGSFLGALTGAVWAFLRTWIASANSFNQLGRGLIIVGILLGWIPGLLAAVAGMAYGIYQGAYPDPIEGIMAVLTGIEIFIQKLEASTVQSNLERRSLDWQGMDLLPLAAAKLAKNTQSKSKRRS